MRTEFLLLERVAAPNEQERRDEYQAIADALIAEQLATECDFLSIGTNDLTQYTLAMDRMHTELAHRIDGLHPGLFETMRGKE